MADLSLRVLIATTAILACSTPAIAERYQAVLRDGERIVGDDLTHLHGSGEATLDGRRLFDPENPVRRLRDMRRQAIRPAVAVELANGDLLPGRLVEWAPVSVEPAAPARFVVEPFSSGPDGEFVSECIAVRQECVRRFGPIDGSDYTPGLFVTRDGRRAIARSFRFTDRAMHALTDAGVATVPFGDLVELHLPQSGGADVLDDGVWSDGEADAAVVRAVTEEGAELTYCRSVETLTTISGARNRGAEQPAHLAVRPAWACETVYLDPQAIVSLSYRGAGEIPLSLLPAETLESRSVLPLWRWRRNANVRGGRLASGSATADLGVGMHSYSAVAFSLPPGARTFSSWVGLDAAVGNGGCVVCRIHRDDLDGPMLWESGFLRGGQEPARVGPLDISAAKRLVLVVDFGHEGRPADADPWDVRDEVDWIDPVVTIDAEDRPQPETEPQRWIPQLAGWQVPDDMRERFSLRPFWDAWRKEWRFAMTAAPSPDETPLELTRTLRVDLTNAIVPIAAATASLDRRHHAVRVAVDGVEIRSTMNGILRTAAARRREASSRVWSLGEFQGEQVKLSVLIEPAAGSEDEPMGLVWETLGPRPLVDNLPPDGRPLIPDRPLTSLTPLSATAAGRPIAIQPGRLTDGNPLEIRGWRFEEGFGVPTESEVTYRLEPQWRRLVAIIGLADGWQGAGPYSILLDGRPYWECREPLSFGRNTPALQIDVPIPPGHETVTLRVQGHDSHAAWACAGFVAERESPSR